MWPLLFCDGSVNIGCVNFLTSIFHLKIGVHLPKMELQGPVCPHPVTCVACDMRRPVFLALGVLAWAVARPERNVLFPVKEGGKADSAARAWLQISVL